MLLFELFLDLKFITHVSPVILVSGHWVSVEAYMERTIHAVPNTILIPWRTLPISICLIDVFTIYPIGWDVWLILQRLQHDDSNLNDLYEHATSHKLDELGSVPTLRTCGIYGLIILHCWSNMLHCQWKVLKDYLDREILTVWSLFFWIIMVLFYNYLFVGYQMNW